MDRGRFGEVGAVKCRPKLGLAGNAVE
jgi:hypothetical protein